MARAIGSTLPSVLLERLRGDDLASRVGIAVIVLTVDAAGWPHPAMLSYGEIVAADDRRIRLAVRPESGTAENLRCRSRLTFCFVEAGMAYYVKASAVELPQTAGGVRAELARFESTVEMVLSDSARDESEAGTVLVDGVRFAPGRPVPAVLRDWRAALDTLRESA